MFPRILISDLMLLLQGTTCQNNLVTWGNFGVFTYLLFPENFDVKAFETKMQGMYDAYMKTNIWGMNIKIEYILEPITRIHLYSTNAGEPEPTGSITYVIYFCYCGYFPCSDSCDELHEPCNSTFSKTCKGSRTEKSSGFPPGAAYTSISVGIGGIYYHFTCYKYHTDNCTDSKV